MDESDDSPGSNYLLTKWSDTFGKTIIRRERRGKTLVGLKGILRMSNIRWVDFGNAPRSILRIYGVRFCGRAGTHMRRPAVAVIANGFYVAVRHIKMTIRNGPGLPPMDPKEELDPDAPLATGHPLCEMVRRDDDFMVKLLEMIPHFDATAYVVPHENSTYDTAAKTDDKEPKMAPLPGTK